MENTRTVVDDTESDCISEDSFHSAQHGTSTEESKPTFDSVKQNTMNTKHSKQVDHDVITSDKSHQNVPYEDSFNTESTSSNVTNTKTTQSDDKLPERTIEQRCPRVNSPEKIIFCIDLSEELDELVFRSRSGEKFDSIELVRRAIVMFVHSKHRIDHRHEFGIMGLTNTALWLGESISSDPDNILTILQGLKTLSHHDTFDMSSLFENIMKKSPPPTVDGDSTVLPPPNVVRVIFIYCRSNVKFEFSSKENLKQLQSCPYFFCDSLYIHHPASEDNICEEIFQAICELDQTGLNYVFEVSKNPTKIYNHMAQLLAHPLQRPVQKDVSYKIGWPIEIQMAVNTAEVS